uniref:Uncharacterized protein n=1 Tax=Plectus sambesii TaxID=2011161 RepID=A0A914W622_9BILA
MDERTDGRVGERTGGWTNERTDGRASWILFGMTAIRSAWTSHSRCLGIALLKQSALLQLFLHLTTESRMHLYPNK